MRKAAIYARYSSDNQREESIDAQVRAIREYAEKNDIQIVRIDKDEARPLTIGNRPKFLEMIQNSGSGGFDLVIAQRNGKRNIHSSKESS